MRTEFQKPIIKILSFIRNSCDFCGDGFVFEKNKRIKSIIKKCYFCDKDVCKKCRKEWHKGFDDPECDQFYDHSFYLCFDCFPFFEAIAEDFSDIFVNDDDIYEFEQIAEKIYKKYKNLENYLNLESYEN